MIIAIDTKNLALFSGGISAFVKPLIAAWIKKQPTITFVLVGPNMPIDWLPNCDNVSFKQIAWPAYLPRKLRHPFYDLVLFSKAINKIKPDLIYSPYHDVRLSKRTPSVITVHDTCIGEQKKLYPKLIRLYYELTLKRNLKICDAVITVSHASKGDIIKRYGFPEDKIFIIPNSFDLPASFNIESKEIKNENSSKINLFYAGGADFRKNVKNLAYSLEELTKREYDVNLRVTGNFKGAWERELKGVPTTTLSNITFLGYLNSTDLFNEYLTADTIVYPSLCEGFGRVCLEAMALGTPLACSNLPVLREVSGDYAFYFDPYDIKDIADKILLAKGSGRKESILKSEYSKDYVCALFVEKMHEFINNYN